MMRTGCLILTCGVGSKEIEWVRCPFPPLATLGRGKERLRFRTEKTVQEEMKGGLPSFSGVR